LSLDSVRCFRW